MTAMCEYRMNFELGINLQSKFMGRQTDLRQTVAGFTYLYIYVCSLFVNEILQLVRYVTSFAEQMKTDLNSENCRTYESTLLHIGRTKGVE